LFYYLRVIVAMMKQEEDNLSASKSPLAAPIGGIIALSLLALLIIGLGVYPGWLIEMVKSL